MITPASKRQIKYVATDYCPSGATQTLSCFHAADRETESSRSALKLYYVNVDSEPFWDWTTHLNGLPGLSESWMNDDRSLQVDAARFSWISRSQYVSLGWMEKLRVFQREAVASV